MIKQTFRTDRKFWTQQQCDEIQLFFQYNTFFSKFYEHQDFEKVVAMTFYHKIPKNGYAFLQNNKRPEAIILLSGKVELHKKRLLIDSNKKKKTNKLAKQLVNTDDQTYIYQPFTLLNKQNQSIILDSECKISALQNNQAQILFIPSILFNAHQQNILQKKIELLYQGLKSFFPEVERKALIKLAKQGCYFKEFRINQYIYRAKTKPTQVFLLLQGNVKLQKPGFSAQKTFKMCILNVGSIFGEKDILLQQRQMNSISCSAYARTLVIPKKPFIRFAKQYLPKINYLNQQESSYKLPNLNSSRNSLNDLSPRKKDRISRFHSINTLQPEKVVQKRIIKNCHILINLSPKGSRTTKFFGRNSKAKDYTKDQFKEKIKLFNKIRPDARIVDIQNPLIECRERKKYSFRCDSSDNEEH